MIQPFIKRKRVDFVVPIKKIGMFTKAVLEGIQTFYAPKRIFVVTNQEEKDVLEKEIIVNNKEIVFVDEETFFVKHFGLTMTDLNQVFCNKTDNCNSNYREFGWWYQQLIKLGASTQIEDISESYVVWDGDLIPLTKWELCSQDTFHAAILQDQPRSEFNRQEYNKCIRHLLGINVAKPFEGTFVTHHMVFEKKYLKKMFEHIHDTLLLSCSLFQSWPIYFISLSHSFYRFSEYLLYATFMMHYHSDAFHCHSFEKYGKDGIRFRETTEIIQDMKKEKEKGKDCNTFFTYADIVDYFSKNNKHPPSYVQFEHVYFF
jgi:hypothetical protein